MEYYGKMNFVSLVLCFFKNIKINNKNNKTGLVIIIGVCVPYKLYWKYAICITSVFDGLVFYDRFYRSDWTV